MIAVTFPQSNIVLGKDQPEYEALPAYCQMQEIIVPNQPGDPKMAIMTKLVPWSMTCCFQLNKEEIDEIIRTGVLWHTQQAISMSTQNPFEV